jgi:hypothetical protein
MRTQVKCLLGIAGLACALASAAAQAAEPSGIELPFPFPVVATLSVPDSATPDLLARFRGVRGLSLEIRAEQANLLRDPLLQALAGEFARVDKRVMLRAPLKAALLEQLRRLDRLEVEVLLGPDVLTPEDRRLLAGLGPVRVLYRLPSGFTSEQWEQVEPAKHSLVAIDLGPAGLDPARWALLLQKPRRHRRFVLGAGHPPLGIYPLTQARPLELEIRTARNALPGELLEVLKDLRGVDLCLVVDGRFTRQHATPWDRLERFRLKIVVEGPGDITPGLAALLERIGPR